MRPRLQALPQVLLTRLRAGASGRGWPDFKAVGAEGAPPLPVEVCAALPPTVRVAGGEFECSFSPFLGTAAAGSHPPEDGSSFPAVTVGNRAVTQRKCSGWGAVFEAEN